MLILHHYWPSPFAHKIRMAFGLAKLDWLSVEIPRVPPKPLLTPLTAGYRRTPVLQIGADVYCDTQNIARTLGEQGAREMLFPEPSGTQALVLSDWIDQQLFPLAARVVITSALDKAPPEFVKDRGDLYFGSDWSVEQLKTDFGGVVMQLNAGLYTLNASVAGRDLKSSDLSYADVAVAFLCWFLRGRWERGPEVLSAYPKLCEIESAVCALGHHGSDTALDAEAALQIAHDAEPESAIGVLVPSEFTVGQPITIQPFIASSDPAVQGTLRFLDQTRVSIDHVHPMVGRIAVHFPVLGYQIRPL